MDDGPRGQSYKLYSWNDCKFIVIMATELFSRRRWRLASAQLSNKFGYCPSYTVSVALAFHKHHLGRYKPSIHKHHLGSPVSCRAPRLHCLPPNTLFPFPLAELLCAIPLPLWLTPKDALIWTPALFIFHALRWPQKLACSFYLFALRVLSALISDWWHGSGARISLTFPYALGPK